MPWAVHAAELRLWLQLVVESPLEPKDLRTYPLLPNLNMNLRVGDSLVQEIGGMTLHLRDPKLSEKVKKKLVELKQEKENYINNVPTAKFKRKEEVEKEEIRIFQEITEERLQFIENEIKNIRNKIKGEESQKTLTGEKVALDEERRKKIEQLQMRLERYNREEYELKRIRENLVTQGKKPFVWEIDFAEIFGEKAGFDIVIGNPPYVRHGLISPPNRLKEEVTQAERESYMNKLLKSVQTHFPSAASISKKSDYYVYFYFHGLALLNPEGTFCFVTSNSWLDVSYGATLQEFLLKYVPIVVIYESQVKRTFEHADINTIIALFRAPRTESSNSSNEYQGFKFEEFSMPAASNVCAFVLFKKSFEEIVNSDNLIEIEKATTPKTTDKYRVYPARQRELLEEGWEYPEGLDTSKIDRFSLGKYVGNKWGGKYLRAPDIFFLIIARSREKLVRLGNFGHIETYLNTGGADKFFFVKEIREIGKRHSEVENTEYDERFIVESKFLQPIIKSSQGLEKITVERKNIDNTCLVLIADKLSGREKIVDYIKFGEKKGYNKRSGTKNRSPWYSLPKQAYESAEVLFPRDFSNNHKVFFNKDGIVSNRFYRFHVPHHKMESVFVLNSTLASLFFEIFGRVNLGLGALDLEKPDLNQMLILNPALFDASRAPKEFLQRKISDIFEECGVNSERPIREQEPSPKRDRMEVDNQIFSILGLSSLERKEVYWSVCELVKNRLEKAESLKGKNNA
jgi:hypothetical protein